MTDAPLLNLIAAREARDEGLAQVADNQDEAWKAEYRTLADAFLLTREPGDTFIGEGLRVFAQGRGLESPHHPNAWGAMASGRLRRWLKAGLIALDGMENARSISTHAHAYRRYRVL